MQIVIDISEKDYRIVGEIVNAGMGTTIDEAIINGTPLPKGHGRLIDADVLREEVYSWGMNDYEPSDFTDAIDDAPTVEAIPKADYENCLKADKVAMLEELKKEIEEKATDLCDDGWWLTYNDIIQEKIDKLKENKE